MQGNTSMLCVTQYCFEWKPITIDEDHFPIVPNKNLSVRLIRRQWFASANE